MRGRHRRPLLEDRFPRTLIGALAVAVWLGAVGLVILAVL